MSKYTGLSVVVLQTTGDTNCIAFTSVAYLLITSAVSVSDVSFAMFLCGTAIVGGLSVYTEDYTVLQAFHSTSSSL